MERMGSRLLLLILGKLLWVYFHFKFEVGYQFTAIELGKILGLLDHKSSKGGLDLPSVY